MTSGVAPLYRRRLRVATKSAGGLIGLMALPALWILAVAPALSHALGSFSRGVDYFTFLTVSQVVFLVPFTSMFSGLNVLVDKDRGILRELLVAPIRRSTVPLADALGVATIALSQVGLILGLAVAKGADFSTSPGRCAMFLAATLLLSLTTYGVAETLALSIGRQEAYGPLIPAVGVTPFFLAGTLFPVSALPEGFRQFAPALPWTHAVGVMRYGLMKGTDPRLADVWHLHSQGLMAALSLLVLAAFAAVSLTIALRVFHRANTA